MQKIKSIQKGTGKNCIYYTTQITEYQKKQIEKGAIYNYIVDEIIQTWYEKEIKYGDESVQAKVWQGFKNINNVTSLVFEMFNPDLIIYDNN